MKTDVWVKITENVFRDAKFEDITFLIQILSWHPDSSIEKAYFFIDSGSYQEFDNFKKNSQTLQKFIIEKNDDAITSGKTNRPKYIITKKSMLKSNEFSLHEAIRFFLTPVMIVLENSLNDGYFLKAMFKHFGEIRNGKNVLEDFVKNDWVQFVNAGGWTNIRNFIEGRQQALKGQYRIPLFLRVFILIDSDKTSANSSLPGDKEKLKADMEKEGIIIHILEKRAMENYMPDEVVENLYSIVDFTKYASDTSFSGWLGSQAPKDWIKNYKYYFTSEQKDYMEYQKEGLGFPHFKTEFPKFFEFNSYVNASTLLTREGGTIENNEFLIILNKIYSLL